MLSTTTAIIHWDEPEEPNGQVVGYRVYYTSNNLLPVNQVCTRLLPFAFPAGLITTDCEQVIEWLGCVLMLHSGRSRWCAVPTS